MNLPKKMFLLSLISLLMFAAVSAKVEAFSPTPPETTVYVHPEETTVKVGETFQVYINIRDVSRLQGFDFRLSYDTRLLDCTGLEEGTFLSDVNHTFVAKLEVDDGYCCTLGRVWLAVCIYGIGYADGNGTLAIITFNATATGETVLDLYSDHPYKADEIKLTTCGSEAILNKATDGCVIIVASNPSDPDDPSDPIEPDPADGVTDVQHLLTRFHRFAWPL